jgi:hypothetical protein
MGQPAEEHHARHPPPVRGTRSVCGAGDRWHVSPARDGRLREIDADGPGMHACRTAPPQSDPGGRRRGHLAAKGGLLHSPGHSGSADCRAEQQGTACRAAPPAGRRQRHAPDPADVTFQQLLRPLLLPGPLPDQGAPVPAQIPQLPLPRRRHERRAQHPPLGQLAQPHGVQLVRLGPAGDVLDIAGVDHPALDVVFEQVERRLPVGGGGSITHSVTSWHVSQSRSSSSADVVVANVRTSCSRRPGLLPCGTRTHAVSVALPISSAATRATISASSVISSTGLPFPHLALTDSGAARGSQQGRQGGIARSRQQCRTLVAAPSARPTYGLKHQARPASEGNHPLFSRPQGVPARTPTTNLSGAGMRSRPQAASGRR